MNATDAAAWWGAVIATFVFLWDIYKWKTAGAKVQLSARPNMQSFDSLRGIGNEKYVFVEVSNRGDRSTTITHLYGTYYASSWAWFFRKKPTTQFVVLTPAFAQPLPFLLEVGARWTGALVQNEEVDRMMTRGRFYCGVYYSGSNKPAKIRVTLKDSVPSEQLDTSEA